ncbi:DUF4144 family protein [Vibrio lentus]|nr:DUF4144 family protein [Vibrio lentus]
MVKLDSDDELIIYVASEHEFNEMPDMILGEDDYLIDSVGDSYSLESSSNQLSLAKQPEQYSIRHDQADSKSQKFPEGRSGLMKIHF